MSAMVEAQPHGVATRAIHWATAMLVLSAWVVGSTMEDLPRDGGRDLAMQIHYSLGVLVLGLATLRVAWRILVPSAPPEGPAWQRMAATAMHLGLIGLLVALPLSGLLDRWARGRPVTVFGGLPLPAPFAATGERAWGEVHEVLATLLLVAVVVHVLAALWHRFVMKDGTLSRMLPPAGR